MWVAFENDRTFADFLGSLPPAVHEIFSCAAHRATGELDELAAGAGIGRFARGWAGKGSLIARNLRGGTGQLPDASWASGRAPTARSTPSGPTEASWSWPAAARRSARGT
jgi:hypothetical protein